MENCINKGAEFIESSQRTDGSWLVFGHHGYISRNTTCCYIKFLLNSDYFKPVCSNRFGSWGICFTYATWFAVMGLVCSGRTSENSATMRKACDFLLSKELPSGGWGESYLSSHDEVISVLTYKFVWSWFYGIRIFCREHYNLFFWV